ncbi:GMC family oxidoreductase [Nocardioides sp.]|uniref:GMC family oxidoreductase n=1 Tax=Nocardioides sp. TaxID=35761 RepID=UPI003D0E0336
MARQQQYALNEPVDVLVIGTGAGGGNVIRELCLNGVQVVALEAGPRFEPERDFVNDELTMFNKLSSTDAIIPAGDAIGAFPVWAVKGVGGSTVHWTGNALRAREHELRARTVYGDIEGASLADWPVTLEELNPFYDMAERYLGVTGRVQPLQTTNANFAAIKPGADKLGLNMRATPIGVNAHGSYDGRAQCTQRGHCMQGCSNGAMWSTLTEAIPKAEKTGWLELRTGCQALTINLDSSGRATSVTYARADGTIEEQRASIIVVAGNSVNTPRLLLNSASPQAPDGLANSSGQVGRNFMCHVTGTSFALMPHEVHAYKGITTTGMIDSFSENLPEEVGYVGGFNLVTVSMGMATLSIFGQPGSLISKPGSRGNWGGELVHLMENYTRLAGLHFVGEDMPNPRNGVSLHPTMKDAFGMPVSVLEYNDHPNNAAMRRRGWDKATEIFQAAGAESVMEVPPFPDTHLLGTCRMGSDPETSVVNGFGQAHDVENLFIADGSVFPTSTAENPSLTISALAIRQAHHIMSVMAGNEE